jgi:hypothetical protein
MSSAGPVAVGGGSKEELHGCWLKLGEGGGPALVEGRHDRRGRRLEVTAAGSEKHGIEAGGVRDADVGEAGRALRRGGGRRRESTRQAGRTGSGQATEEGGVRSGSSLRGVSVQDEVEAPKLTTRRT